MFLSLGHTANAQSINQSLQELQHTAWTDKDGLYGTVTAIVQAPDGFLWLGTKAGLYRFDGVTFNPYKPTSGSVPTGGPTRMLAAADGVVWAAYEGGKVASLRGGSAHLYTEKDGYPYGGTRDLAQTRDGVIWAALIGGLARFDGNAWHKVRKDWSYGHTAAQCLFVDRNDTLWVCSGTDLSYLPSGSHQFHDLGLSIPRIVAVRQSRDGILWLSDGDKDVVQPFRSPLEPDSLSRLPQAIPIGSWDILFPKDDSVWFGTEHGVRRLPSYAALCSEPSVTQESAEVFDKKDGITDRIVFRLFQDREGNIWAGTAGGLDRFRKRRLAWIGTNAPPNIVQTEDGDPLAIFLGDAPAQFFASHHVVPKEIASMGKVFISAHTSDGSVWFFKRGSTIRWKGDKFEDFPFPKYDANSRIYAITVNRAGTIWASISGLGLAKLEGGIWTRIPVLPGEPDIAPISLALDSKGQVWAGYDSRQRVALICGSAVVHIFTPSDGLDVGLIHTVTTVGNSVWVGGDSGLATLRGDHFTLVTDEDGAPLPVIQYVTTTPEDGLWLGSQRGIIHIFRDDLRSYLDGHARGVKYEVLDTESDLPEPLSTAGVSIGRIAAQPSWDHATKGQLWFETIAGAASIDLAHLQRNTIVPPVVITGLVTDQHSYSTEQGVTLPPKTRYFTIAYTALSLTNAVRNQFKVRLDGWDTQWQNVGSRRDSSYANLAPGTYTFQVIASNNDGLWNSTGSALTIRILPAYYQTYWFRILCLVVLAIIAWIIYTWRVQSLIKRSNDLLLERLSERERIAHDLHDTFLQSVQGLLLRFHSAAGRLSHGDPTRALLEETLKQSDGVMLEGRGLVLDLHTAARASGDLLDELRSIGEEYKAYNPVSFSVSVTGRVRPLNAIVSNELYSFASEALSNAFRHSGAQTIAVEVSYDNRQLLLSFCDDGRGIAPEILEAGHLVGHWGLQGMKERAKRMGSHLGLKSSANSGTQITLAIPADIAYTEKRRLLSRMPSRQN